MDIRTLAALPLSAERGWPDLLRARPGWRSLFLQLVLPVSLVPPAVLYLAGTVGSGAIGTGIRHWGALAIAVFLAEFASVAVAGPLLRQVAQTHELAIGCQDARLLATLAPLPVWASTAGVALPGVAAPAAVLLVGVVLACATAYHGLVAICHPREDFMVAAVVHVVASAGLAAWLLLAALLAALA